MLQRLLQFFKRNRRKFITLSVFFGGSYVISKYVIKRIRDKHEKQTVEMLSQARKTHHFDSSMRTCNMTVLSMMSTLKESIIKEINIDDVTHLLKTKPSNRYELWEDLKTMSLTQALSVVYITTLLVVLLRVQLSVLSGYMYLSISGISENEVTPQVQQTYIQNINLLLSNFICDIINNVKSVVHSHISDISLKQNMSSNDVHELIWRIRQNLEYSVETSMFNHPLYSSYFNKVFPNESHLNWSLTNSEDSFVMKLMNETREIIESEDYKIIHQIALNIGFKHISTAIDRHYCDVPISSNESILLIPLAKLIPVVSGFTQILCSNQPNLYVQELILNDSLKVFSANLYEAFSQSD